MLPYDLKGENGEPKMKLFVIIANVREYDDSDWNIIGILDNEDAAKAKVVELEAKLEEDKAKQKAWIDANTAYEHANPAPWRTENRRITKEEVIAYGEAKVAAIGEYPAGFDENTVFEIEEHVLNELPYSL